MRTGEHADPPFSEPSLTNLALTLLLGAVAACVIACVLCYGHLSRRRRRLLAVSSIGIGSVFLAIAYGATGDRTTRLRALFLHHHCVVDEPTAPAAMLPLLLGVTALSAGLLGLLGGRSTRLGLAAPLTLAAVLTTLRYGIDLAAAPEPLAHAFGVTWMIPGLGLFAALRQQQGESKSLLLDLAVLAIGIRAPALTANAITTHFDLGSHYSLVRVERIAIPFADGPAHFVPQSLHQFLLLGVLPQLVIWPLITFAGALLCANLARKALSVQPSLPTL